LEADVVNGTISSKAATLEGKALGSKWQDEDFADTISRALTGITPSETQKLNMLISAPLEAVPYTLTIDVDYTLASEPFTPLKKTMLVELEYTSLFEAKFNFGPLLHTDQWPSYFDPSPDASQEHPAGIPQKWRVGCHVTSLASARIVIRNAKVAEKHIDELSALKCVDGGETEPETIAADDKFDRTFQVETQKISLDDRRPTLLELELLVDWARTVDSRTQTTRLPMPRLTLPSSEPRVLCTLAHDTDTDADVTLQYHLENPSTHFLTFALTMEANEDFAFSGPKYRTLSLAPLSRHRVEYQLVVHDGGEETKASEKEGRWIWPALQVVDSYYQKTLRVQAASERVKIDPQRGLGVWVAGRME
jgi:trafficking protein particle complex subunit 11